MVEVPTIASNSSLHGPVEQNDDIPLPHGRGGRVGHGGLQGVSQGQGSTAFRGTDLVDIPVPRRGGLHGPASTASSSHSPGAEDEAFTGFCRTFSQNQKSARLGPHSGRNSVRTLIHGLRRLMPTPWRLRRTSWRRSRSRSRSWRRTP